MEAELIALYGLHHLGIAIFGKFEVESPWWRWMLKWCIVVGLLTLCYTYFGHTGAWLYLGTSFPVSIIVHVAWCRSHGIDPWKATPRKKYYELRGWKWKE